VLPFFRSLVQDASGVASSPAPPAQTVSFTQLLKVRMVDFAFLLLRFKTCLPFIVTSCPPLRERSLLCLSKASRGTSTRLPMKRTQESNPDPLAYLNQRPIVII
jgi:hypothetical protein